MHQLDENWEYDPKIDYVLEYEDNWEVLEENPVDDESYEPDDFSYVLCVIDIYIYIDI